MGKTLVLAFGLFPLPLIRFGRNKRHVRIACKLMFWSLFINIIVAVLLDLQYAVSLQNVSMEMSIAHGINFVAGCGLMISQFYQTEMIQENVNFIWKADKKWIVAYTLWNGSFVMGYGKLGEKKGVLALIGGTVLLVPLLFEAYLPGIWLQVRFESLLNMTSIVCAFYANSYPQTGSLSALDNYSKILHLVLATSAFVANVTSLFNDYNQQRIVKSTPTNPATTEAAFSKLITKAQPEPEQVEATGDYGSTKL